MGFYPFKIDATIAKITELIHTFAVIKGYTREISHETSWGGSSFKADLKKFFSKK